MFPIGVFKRLIKGETVEVAIGAGSLRDRVISFQGALGGNVLGHDADYYGERKARVRWVEEDPQLGRVELSAVIDWKGNVVRDVGKYQVRTKDWGFGPSSKEKEI